MANIEIVDIAGIGFGPSNLALAIALEEFNAERDSREAISAQFVESKEAFGWHPGMLLPGTTMQISFLKDLATQRNARSRYTFLNYLAEMRRLPDFINHQTFFPSRIEFHDYLEWCARTVAAEVAYGTRAESIEDAGDHFEILLSGQQSGVLRARNIVVATGLSQRLPDGMAASRRIFHNHQLLDHLARMPEPTHQNFVVLGAGQSAAEVVAYLHSAYPRAAVHAVFAKYGLSPADDSPYANRIFDATAVDDYHAASPEFRARLMGYHRGTNYSAVDLPLIEDLYAREYTERVTGERRLFMHGASNASAVEENADGVTVTVVHEPTGLTEEMVCDAVVCATGFHPMNLRSVLGTLADQVVTDTQGPRVTRDYRLVTTSPLPGGIFLQGGTEHTHGISSSLLSNVAVRNGEIVRSIARDQHRRPATVDSAERIRRAG